MVYVYNPSYMREKNKGPRLLLGKSMRPYLRNSKAKKKKKKMLAKWFKC
jgi:hypothetical protein